MSTIVMSSNRPYLLRAMYDWIADNGMTPYILVDAAAPGVDENVGRHAVVGDPFVHRPQQIGAIGTHHDRGHGRGSKLLSWFGGIASLSLHAVRAGHRHERAK